jgi:Bacterial Ig domain
MYDFAGLLFQRSVMFRTLVVPGLAFGLFTVVAAPPPQARAGGPGRGASAGPMAEPHVFAAAKGKTLTVGVPGLARGTANTLITLAAPPSHGKVAIKPDGSFLYTPNGDYTGIDTFTFKLASSGAATSTGTVTVVIK